MGRHGVAEILAGAVVLVGQGGKVVYLRAFGSRALEPVVEPMSVDTVFDLASLTKVIATTTAVLQLAERRRLLLDARLDDAAPARQPGRHGRPRKRGKRLPTPPIGR